MKKRDGQYRFCVNYRNLNQITTKDSYSLPNIDDTVEQLGGSSYFSKLDLKNGYFQVRIAESDKPKNSLLGNNRWNYCLIYLDDVMIYSRRPSTNTVHISTKYFQLNPSNPISRTFDKPLRDNIDAIMKVSNSRTAKQVHSSSISLNSHKHSRRRI